MVVSSALVSYAGATSTISAETMCKPSRPRRIVRSSRVDQPPVSGVPVAGAKAGSMESIYTYQLALQDGYTMRFGGTYVDGEIDGLVAYRLTYFLDDAIRACRQFGPQVSDRTYGKRGWGNNIPMVSISRASMRWNPDASSFV